MPNTTYKIRSERIEKSILASLPYGDPKEEGWTVRELSEHIDETPAVISRALERLLEQKKIRRAWCVETFTVASGTKRGRTAERAYRVKRHTIAADHTRTRTSPRARR